MIARSGKLAADKPRPGPLPSREDMRGWYRDLVARRASQRIRQELRTQLPYSGVSVRARPGGRWAMHVMEAKTGKLLCGGPAAVQRLADFTEIDTGCGTCRARLDAYYQSVGERMMSEWKTERGR